MNDHNKTSGIERLKGTEIQLIPSWFIPGVSVIVEVLEREDELAVWVLPLEVWKDREQIIERIESLLGGRAQWISEYPKI